MANKLLQQLVQKRVLSKTKASLKAATPVVEDPTLQTWIKEVSSTVKEIASTGVRKNDLVKAGIATISNGELQNALQPDEEINLTVPDAVINLEASGAYSSITLTWETRPSKYFGMNIIYRSEVNDFGTATQIGSTMGDVYTDYVGNNIKAYYWVRTVSSFGVEGKLAPSVSAETAIDVAYVMEQITGQINASHLNELLQSDLEAIHQLQADLVAEAQARIADILQKATELNNLAALLRQEAEAKVGAVTADLNQKAADLNNRVTNVKTEVTEMIESVDDKVDSLGTAIQTDIDALDDGLTQEIQKRIDGDSTITTALNAYKQSNDNAVAVVLKKAETAISANSATASDVTALQTRMTTAEGSIANKADATAFNLLSTEVTKVKNDVRVNSSDITSLTANLETVTDTADTALSTASSAKTTAESAVTKNTALSQRVDSLAAAITDLGEGAETNVDVYAFNALKAEVISQGGDIDANTQNITSIGSRLTTAEGKVTGNTTAINNLKTTQTTQGNTITQAVEDITALENSIETIESNVSKKADATTVTSLSNQVTEQAGKIKTTSDSLTQLTNQVGVVEGNLAKKVDSTALVNYYTKTEVEDKALTTAAGEVSKYDASLVIGGSNLYTGPNPVVLRNQSAPGRIDFTAGGTGNLQRFNYLTADNFDISSLSKDDPTIASIEVFIPSTTTSDYTIQFGTYKFSSTGYRYAPTVDVKDIPKDTWVKLVTEPGKWPATTTQTGVNLVFNLVGTRVLGDSFQWRNFMMEKASKASEFKESDKAIQSKIDANATAIQNTNVEVGRVDGKTTVNTNAITGLTSRMNTVEGQVSTKAEASALQNYYTKNEADDKSLTLAAGEVNKFKAGLFIGGRNLVLDESNIVLSSNNSANYPISNSVVDGIRRFERTAPYSSTLSTYCQTQVNLEKGKTYTGSVEVRPVKTQLQLRNALMPVTVDNVKPFSGTVYGPVTICPPGVWTRLTCTVTATADGKMRVFAIYNSDDGYVFSADTGAIEYRNLQVEEGEYATAFTANESEIKASIDANAQAINTTNAEVVRVEGRVSTNANNITTLTNSINTLSGSKLDASVIAGYYTKGQTDDKIESVSAGKVESFRSSIENSIEAIKMLPISSSVGSILRPNSPDLNNISLVSDDTTTASYVLKVTGLASGSNIFAAEHVPFNPNRLYRVKYRLKRTAGTGVIYPAVVPMNMYKTGGITANNSGLSINTISSVIYPLTGSTTAMPLNVWVEGTYYIKGRSASGSTGAGTLTNPRTMPNLGAYLRLGFICPLRTDFLIEYFILEEADDEIVADALTTTNTEVTRIDGAVKAHSTQLIELNAAVAGKAGADALSSLKAAVEDVEGKYTSQAQSITDLKANVKDTLDTVTIKDVRSKNELPIFYWDNYRSRRVNEFKYQSVIGVSSFFSGTYCNLETIVYWTDSSGGPIIQTATSGSDPSLYVQRQSSGSGANAVWTAWKQPIKDLRDELGGKASAQAVSTLEATVNGMSTHAEQLTLLRTDVNNNANALAIQAKVVNGVKASYMVKMETNGVIGGFGMVQETGALGKVTTSFGVNADTFFIGSPSSKKKPFAVLGSSGSINGVTVPAGTYIDTAYIPDGTITNAKIGNLSADKITAGNIAADRMKANIVAAAQGQFTTLSALSAKIGVLRTATSGARTEIKDNLIEVYDSSGKLRVRLGVWS